MRLSIISFWPIVTYICSKYAMNTLTTILNTLINSCWHDSKHEVSHAKQNTFMQKMAAKFKYIIWNSGWSSALTFQENCLMMWVKRIIS